MESVLQLSQVPFIVALALALWSRGTFDHLQIPEVLLVILSRSQGKQNTHAPLDVCEVDWILIHSKRTCKAISRACARVTVLLGTCVCHRLYFVREVFSTSVCFSFPEVSRDPPQSLHTFQGSSNSLTHSMWDVLQEIHHNRYVHYYVECVYVGCVLRDPQQSHVECVSRDPPQS